MLTVASVVGIFLAGCGGDDTGTKEAIVEGGSVASTTDTLRQYDTTTVEGAIAKALNDAMDRLRYDDKSGLWENEFSYLHDGEDFDFYMRRRQIFNARADSITYLEVRNVQEFEDDSAAVEVRVHFLGPSGTPTHLDDNIIVYRHNERWIKPTVSVYEQQAMYDSIRQEAIDAARREAEK